MQQPSAPPLPTSSLTTNNHYVPAPYYNQVQQPQPIYYAPYFVEPQPQQQQQQTIGRSEGCFAGFLSTLFCCCLIAEVVDD
jgi:hypothetical protein